MTTTEHILRGAPVTKTGARPVDHRSLILGRLRKIRGWMILLPMDAVALAAPALWHVDQFKSMLALSACVVVSIASTRGYRAKLHQTLLDELPSLLAAAFASIGVVAVVFSARHDDKPILPFLTNASEAVGLFILGRAAVYALINWARKQRLVSHHAILVGGGKMAVELADVLRNDPRYGLRLLGYVDSEKRALPAGTTDWLGSNESLSSIIRQHKVEVLLVADSDLSEEQILDSVEGPDARECDVYVLPRLYNLRTHGGRSDHIGSIPIVRVGQATLDGPAKAIKRLFDVSVSAFLLAVLSPLLGLCALLVKLSPGNSILYRQKRIGINGSTFDCLKFRSMRPATDEEALNAWSGSDSDAMRITTIGKILRRTSMDELPQLWNILKGEMSIVGPRPERPVYVEEFTSLYDVYGRRHRVTVGLTGFAQVSGLRGDTSIAQRARFDNYYIENWSLWLDIKIMIRTLAEVVLAKGR